MKRLCDVKVDMQSDLLPDTAYEWMMVDLPDCRHVTYFRDEENVDKVYACETDVFGLQLGDKIIELDLSLVMSRIAEALMTVDSGEGTHKDMIMPKIFPHRS